MHSKFDHSAYPAIFIASQVNTAQKL